MCTASDQETLAPLLATHPFTAQSEDSNLFLRHLTEVLRDNTDWYAVIPDLSHELRRQLSHVCQERIAEYHEVVDMIHQGFAAGYSHIDPADGSAEPRRIIASLENLAHALSV